MMENYKIVGHHFDEVMATIHHMSTTSVSSIVERLELARKRGKTVFTMGNGGSAATASHFANDLMKMGALRAISIPDMTPTVTAYGNDIDWENMFWRPFKRMAKDGDILFAFSCSGDSDNIITALRLCASSLPRCERVLLTGNKVSRSARLSDYAVFVPHSDIRVQEDIHMIVCHAIVGALKEN